MRKRNKAAQKRIASERIRNMMSLAWEKRDLPESDRYVEIARAISRRYNIRLPSDLKRRICRRCSAHMIPGRNCRVRVTGKTITYTCNNCKSQQRIGYKKRFST